MAWVDIAVGPEDCSENNHRCSWDSKGLACAGHVEGAYAYQIEADPDLTEKHFVHGLSRIRKTFVVVDARIAGAC